jgi:hypothetical protein
MTLYTAHATVKSVDDAIGELRAVREKARRWLLDHVEKDGKPVAADEKNAYYRLPWTFINLGERETAARVMSWMEREALTETGDLREGAPRADFTSRGATYPLSLMAHGAWLLERYDTAQAIINTLRGLRNAATGGAYWERPEARRTAYELAYPTAQLGLTALLTGQSDIADDAYAWFVRLWHAQPELPDLLYGAWGPDGLVLRPDEADRFRCIVDFRAPRQAFYIPGISAAFLSRYYLARRETTARDLALSMLMLNENGTSEQFNYRESMQICKFGWGSALAYEMESDERHLKNILRMADWYRKSQAEDGSWVPSPFLTPKPSVADALYKTAEHTLWVSYMLTALAGTAGRGPVSHAARV